VIGEGQVSVRQLHLGHMAAYALRLRIGTSLCMSGSRGRCLKRGNWRSRGRGVAGQTFDIVGGILADDIQVRIVTGDATDAGIGAVEALAVGKTVRLEANGQLAAPVIPYNGLP